MRRRLTAVLLLTLLLAGCQCCQCTETIGDVVDAVSTHQCAADGLYCAGLDLTRIGRRDWCQCGINSWLCPCRCNQYCPEDGTCPR